MTEDNDSELDTTVVEFTCPSEQASEPDSPVDQLTKIFRKASLRFAVEEYRISRQEILDSPDWKDWRESHQGEIPPEVSSFVFLSSKQDRPKFCQLFEEWMQKMQQQAEEQSG